MFNAIRRNLILLYTLIIAFVFVGLAVAFIYTDQKQTNETASINSFGECIAAGYPVMESYPEICVTDEGATFTNPAHIFTYEQCQSYETDDCPAPCVVCPPCRECSSISCQTKEFCETLGFNSTWYEDIKARINEQNGSGTELANPASVFCEENGGRLEFRENEDGTIGYCIFTNSTECEEWAFYRGECSP